ncbi:MAG: formate/nitrite transporter family protein [Clostridia bacterium]|nr:formate/nitrite transporter family protein [Clostridia bacterium]
MLNKIASGICAGILISIGGSIFLSCENKIVGALLFTVALLCICYKGYSLFTGKVGYLPEKADKEAFSVLLLGLLGNAIGTIACGYLLRYAIPAIGAAAETLCSGKLETQALWQTFVRAIFCGVLMYLAVSIFRDSKTPIGILFCIPVFILSGFEHSIADLYYFAASGIVSLRAFAFLWTVIAGNAVGGVLLGLLMKIGRKEKANG